MNRHEEKRFWKKVIKGPTRNACWLWVGAIGDDGYGRFWTQAETGKQCMLRAHRAAAEIIYGHNAIAEKLVTHLCDNPLRDLTLTYGYDQHQVDELVRGIIMTGQIPLF